MSNLVLKTKQFNDFQSFMRSVIQLTKEGKEVDLTKTLVNYGRLYFLKYWDEAEVQQEVQQKVVAEEAKDEVSTEVDLSKLSVAELRKLCDTKGIKYAPAAKEAKLIELLSK